MRFLKDFHLDSLRRYFHNTLWMISEKIVRLCIALVVSVLLARALGPADFGLLQYALSFAGLFGLLATLGMDPILVRELVRDHDRTGDLLGTVAGLRVFAAIAVMGMLVMSNWFAGHETMLSLMILCVGAGYIPQAFLVIEQMFQARVLAKFGTLAYLAAVALGAIWVVVGIKWDAPVEYFAIQPLLESLLIAFGLWLVYRWVGNAKVKWRFDRTLAISLMKESWPLILSLGLVSVYINTDKVMIRFLLGDEAVGLYAAASKLSEAWYFVPTVIVNSLFPAIIRARDASPEHYRRRVQNLYDLMVWLAVLVALPVTFISDWCVTAFYGDAYAASGPVLALHIWTGVLVFLGTASGRLFILEGYAKAYLWRTLIGVFGNVVLNLILVPRMGMIGAAWATLIAQFFVVLVFDAFWLPARESFRMKCRALVPMHWVRH